MSTWVELDDNRNTVEIVTSRSCLLQRHDTGALYLHGGKPTSGWHRLDANPVTVQVTAGELWTPTLQGPIIELTVYQRHRHGSVFAQRRVLRVLPVAEPPWVRLDGNPATVDIVAAGTRLFQRHADGSVWVYTGVPMTGWDRIDDGHAAVQVVATEDAVYRLGEDGRISVLRGPSNGWEQLDANPATAAVAAAGTSLHQIHKDGRIFTHRGTGWQLLDDNRATVEIVAAGDKLFQRHADGSIWVYTGVPLTGWRKLDDDRAAVQIAATANALYKRGTRGSIHQFVE